MQPMLRKACCYSLNMGNIFWKVVETSGGKEVTVSDILRANGVEMTIINPRILSSLDKNCLDSLRDYRQIITIEDGIVDGGFGQKVASYMGAYGVRVDVLGLKKEFLDRYDAEKVLVDNGLTPTQIAEIAMDK